MTRLIPDYDLKINDVSIKADNVVENITVALPVNSQATSFTAMLDNGSGTFNNYFEKHDDVKIYLGYQSEGTLGVFHGRVEKVKKNYTKAGTTVMISGRGTWVKLMEKFTINTYASTDLGNIIITEVNALVPAINTGGVITAGLVPAEEFLDHMFLNQMISNYCVKADYFAWVDFDDVLHFTGSPGANEISLDSGEGGNVETINLGIDWKTVRNYIRCYGKVVEEVQLFKTERDVDSIAKYGEVMKLIKNAGMDTTSLVQSIADAALLEDKESEWGGLAVIYGDERIVPGKTITLNVSEIGESGTTYRVRHVNHTFSPKGTGFKTTVMLVQDEEDTSAFYKELFEKTKESTNFANAGNYDESYVYKFTRDQDSLWTFSNTYTEDSSLRMRNLDSGDGTAIITNAIVGDGNYVKVLPFVREDFPLNNANKYYASNDGGITWEQLYPFGDTYEAPLEHTFASSTGDKNDLKFKIEIGEFDSLIAGLKTKYVIGYIADTLVEASFGDSFKQLFKYGSPDGGYVNGVAWYYGKKRLYTTGDDGLIYSMYPTTGNSLVQEADLAIDLGGAAHDGTNLYVMDMTNNRISKRNAADISTEDSNIALETGAGTEAWGLGYDGSNLLYTSRGDGSTLSANSIWVKCSATQRFPELWYYAATGTYTKTGAGYNSINSKFYAVRDGTRFLLEFNVNMIAITAAINMETVAGASDYEPQSCCDDNVTLWTTTTDGTTNRLCKHVAGTYGILAAATYDFTEATYGKWIGICFDGTDFWVLSQLGTYGTFYRINTSGVIQATHTITGTESTGNLWADCEWDGSNLYATYTTKGTTNRDKVLYKFNATPTTISAEIQIGHFMSKKLEYDGPIGRGLAWDGSNFWMTGHYPASITRGQWFPLANATEYGAITEAWFPFDCGADGTYIWFIEDTSFTTKIDAATGEEIYKIVTAEFARGLEYAANVDQSKINTLGAYLKLDY